MTFKYYALVADENPPAVAYSMGHKGGTRVLFKHYRKRVMPSAAKRFWEIRP